MARGRRNAQPPLPFAQKLVLHQYLLGLLGVQDFETLTERLNEPDLEELTPDNRTRFALQLEAHLPDPSTTPGTLTADQLRAYDENIVRHTQAIRFRERGHKWKYFQYLALLFTEVYLDRYFNDPEGFLLALNGQVAKFNDGKRDQDQVSNYEGADLRKIAFWSATGSGKTLLMHVNILQYKHYIEKVGRRRELNRIILLTPNEGLSNQHLEEFEISGIEAEIFSKEGANLFAGQSVEIIEISKLKEEGKEKTVSVDAFESNNLVLIDEGHRGASGKEWREMRKRLAEEGFAFEYSATFGQAVKATAWRELEDEYAKGILFDYSYKYFYKDGYGKDYKILNLADDSDEEVRRLYLTACLLTYYQQLLLFQEKEAELRPFLIERPLWVFVGSSVNVVRTENKQAVSDVTTILLFLAQFAAEANRNESIQLLERLMTGAPGLHDALGREIFANSYPFVLDKLFEADSLYSEILKLVFNANSPGALHVEELKGTDGELSIRLGENHPLGVINVGDAPKLRKLCENYPELVVSDREFSGSLFHEINEQDSKINVLIGAKKFSEGWNSWRVSTMGLMNVGQTEGSTIIQLFGRGVRLKGYEHCLKRHSHIAGIPPRKHLAALETLNIFGIRADYMRQFQEYLKEEGLPSDEEREEIILPVIKTLGSTKLKVPKLKEGLDFKRQGPKPSLERPEQGFLPNYKIVLDWYPRIQTEQSAEVDDGAVFVPQQEGRLSDRHIAFVDVDAIFFEIEDFKNERAWFNLNLDRSKIVELLKDPSWYTLYIPAPELEFTSFARVRRWQEIATALIKKYCDRYYAYQKAKWEAPNVEYRELSTEDTNFIDEYRFLVEQSQQALITKLNQIKAEIEQGSFTGASFSSLHAINFDRHLYYPLIHVGKGLVEVRPVPLNEGEMELVEDLRTHYESNKGFFDGKEMYLLRNMSRGRGIGFFEAGNFFPDFLLWIVEHGKQVISFVDPKGIRNLDGPNDQKIQFFQTIKGVEAQLGDPDVTLESFIISNTPLENINWRADWSYEDFKAHHVLFQREHKATYVGEMFEMLNW